MIPMMKSCDPRMRLYLSQFCAVETAPLIMIEGPTEATRLCLTRYVAQYLNNYGFSVRALEIPAVLPDRCFNASGAMYGMGMWLSTVLDAINSEFDFVICSTDICQRMMHTPLPVHASLKAGWDQAVLAIYATVPALMRIYAPADPTVSPLHQYLLASPDLIGSFRALDKKKRDKLTYCYMINDIVNRKSVVRHGLPPWVYFPGVPTRKSAERWFKEFDDFVETLYAWKEYEHDGMLNLMREGTNPTLLRYWQPDHEAN